MGVILGLGSIAKRIAFDGFRQNYCWLTARARGLSVSCIDFIRIVAATIERHNIVVRKMLDHLEQLRAFTKEILARVRATPGHVILIFAVDYFVHARLQDSVFIGLQQRVPMPPPHHFNHIPASAAEYALKLLDDLAIAAHRPI